MNTKAIFSPNMWQRSMIQDTFDIGWARIEVSYYSGSVEKEKQYFDDIFLKKAQEDINNILEILNNTEGVCYNLPMDALLKCWEKGVKQNQFYEINQIFVLLYTVK